MTFIGFEPPDLQVDDLLQDDINLASPPEIYARLRHLLDRPATTTATLAAVIEKDPALSARLLRLANSAFFAMPHPVHSIVDAVNLIGIRELQNLILATEVIQRFEAIPPDLMDMYAFWRVSLRCAVLARRLAVIQGQADAEAVFIAALLHGIGHLVIFERIPELARKALLEHRHRGLALHVVERAVMGFDYAEVGGALAQRWELPPLMAAVIAHHLEPGTATAFAAESALVHIVLAASAAGSFDADQIAAAAPQDPAVWGVAGLEPAMLVAVLAEAEADFGSALALLH